MLARRCESAPVGSIDRSVRRPDQEPCSVRGHPTRHVKRFGREQDIYGQEDRSEAWYRVLSGAARKYFMRADGRRQVVDFHLAGDFFGLTLRERHRFGVQAVTDGTVIECFPRNRLEAALDQDPEFARAIRLESLETIGRLQEQMIVVGTMTASEKVLAFLTYFCDRLSPLAQSDVQLPISRYDIADLLGISSETVCRAMTELQQRGAIFLNGPRMIRVKQRSKSL
jgi:CRP/FNR family transcriptional regulator, nitrogen fixation regulation protein